MLPRTMEPPRVRREFRPLTRPFLPPAETDEMPWRQPAPVARPWLGRLPASRATRASV